MDFLALWPCSKHGQERSVLAAACEASLYQNSQAKGILVGARSSALPSMGKACISCPDFKLEHVMHHLLYRRIVLLCATAMKSWPTKFEQR